MLSFDFKKTFKIYRYIVKLVVPSSMNMRLISLWHEFEKNIKKCDWKVSGI